MARYTKESIQKLKDAVDLIDLVSRCIPLKKSGGIYKGLCPFHDEKTPSFSIQNGAKYYHCFGCGAHGDAVAFLMQREGLDFQAALRFLSEQYNVPLEAVTENGPFPDISPARIKKLLDVAAQFYHAFLLHSYEAESARTYLQQRGFSLSTIQTFMLGYAPASPYVAKRFLHSQGFSEKEIEISGLVAIKEGRARDFFIDRIMFPILDSMGSTLGFSARKYKEETFGGKYINTPETILFKKSKIFFGIFYSKKRIMKDRRACLVEGQVDALRLIEAGFDYTLATLGTAFNMGHVDYLKALGVEEVFLAFDQDEAGIQSAEKAGYLLMKKGINVKIVCFSEAKDPDELLQKKGKIAWYTAIVEAQDFIPYLIDREKQDSRWNSPVYKDAALRKIVQEVSEWENSVQVFETMKQIAQLAHVPEETLRWQKTAKEVAPIVIVPKDDVLQSDVMIELDLLRWLFSFDIPAIHEFCFSVVSENDFTSSVARKIFVLSQELVKKNQKLGFLDVVGQIDLEGVEEAFSSIAKRPKKPEKAFETVCCLIKEMKQRHYMRQKEAICEQMKLCVASDEQQLYALAQSYDALSKNPPNLDQKIQEYRSRMKL